ncbi:MAG: hypothetical protein E6R03_09285 [Hyphomicrobiaceae bacterium]|nr:MAG: hypothetical protein E6R03_09285 [Hyphomicrobiaceae bacterium]
MAKQLPTVDDTLGDFVSGLSGNLATFSPYHLLLAAVLHRSVLDYLDDTGTLCRKPNLPESAYQKERDRLDAVEFFNYRGDGDDMTPKPFSFRWIAEHLSASDPDGFMERVLRTLETAPRRSKLIEQFGIYTVGRVQKGSGIAPDWKTTL